MKGLSPRELQQVRDFYLEWDCDDTIDASMIEKDILVREAILTVKDVGKDEGC
jgi:hypothetical protein